MDQSYLPAHSEAKIELLSCYLNAYLAIISRDGHTERIFIDDVFCGPGVYQENKTGSPVMVARKLNELHAGKENAPLTYLRLNDKKPENIDSVSRAINALQPSSDKLKLTFQQQKASEVVAYLKSELLGPHDKRFIFLDPFGYKDLKLADIHQLLKGGKTEVLLFQPCSFMRRFSEKATPDALRELMEELSQEEEWPTGLDDQGHANHMRDRFRVCLGDDYFVDSFTIQRSKQIMFALFFFTPHIRGFEKMLEAKWNLNGETGRGWHYSEAQADDLFATPSPQTQALEKHLSQIFERCGCVTNGELYEEVLRCGYLPKHARDVLKTWQTEGQLTIEPASTRKGAFYLTYEQYRDQAGGIKISKIN